MSAVNTDEGTILEALNDKLDRDANNLDTSTTNFDVVVDYQVPTAANNYTWYRKYKSGWVEQGGYTTNNESTPVILPIAMNNANYTLLAFNSIVGNYYARCIAKTTTSFTIDPSVGSSTKGGMWQVSGIAAY